MQMTSGLVSAGYITHRKTEINIAESYLFLKQLALERQALVAEKDPAQPPGCGADQVLDCTLGIISR